MSPLPLVASLVGCFAVHPSRGGGQIELKVPARTPDPAAVAVPPGYRVEAVAAGRHRPD